MPERQWYRVKQTYPKPAAGFLAIGPIYPGEISEDGRSVLFRHHGAPEWTEVVAIEKLEVNPEPPKYRRRWR
jgi:hypothetical protein